MSIISRLKQLEKITVKEMPTPWLICVQGATEEDQKKAAIADYRVKHPDFKRDKFNFILVVSDECKQLTERLLNGVGLVLSLTQRPQDHVPDLGNVEFDNEFGKTT